MSTISGNGISAQVSMQGTYQGRPARVFHILGQREDWINNTAFQDVAEFLDPPSGYLFPDVTGTENWELVCNNAADSAAGTGARTIEIVYLDSNWDLKSSIYTLNGLTPVPIGVTGWRAIEWMEVVTGGSNETAVGNIALQVVGTGVVHERITQACNKSLSARFTVPANYECFVPSWDTHAIRTAFDCRLRGTVNSLTRKLAEKYVFQDLADMGADANGEHGLPFMRFPPRAKIKVSAIPTSLAGSPRLDVSFSVVLIQGVEPP